MNCRVCGLPPAADESATGLEIAATYLATLPVTLHWPVPVGSQVRPRRGLQALSLATTLPDWSAPSFLSKRSPRLAVSRLPTRHVSLMNPECVRKLDPLLSSGIGFH
jgi:hypothetical protein